MKTTLALVTLLGTACGQLDADPQMRTLADTVQAAQRRMHERYDRTSTIIQAIVHGDLDRAHTEARLIAQLDEPAVLAFWKPYFAEVRLAADQVAVAPDPVAAARVVATLGHRCASCHQAASARLTFARTPAPGDRSTKLAPQMIAHQWAAQQMWEGLIGPSDERWLAGAQDLAKAPLSIVAESSALGIADDVARVRLLATRAQKPQSGGERMTLYGDLLATCAHCHAVIRDR